MRQNQLVYEILMYSSHHHIIIDITICVIIKYKQDKLGIFKFIIIFF